MNTNTRDSRRVVLFLPPYEGEILGPPLGLLGLVGALRQARYKADIVDGSLLADFPRRVIEAITDCLCFEASLLTGPMMDAIEISRIIKQVRPDIPVIYGGWHACNYCTDMVFYNRRFNAYTAEHVVTEPTSLVSSRRLTEIALVDSNFLVGVHRAVAIAKGTTDSGVRFLWTFQASTDLLCRMSDEEVALLAASGVRHIGFGTESASPEVLKYINKAHQHVPELYTAAEKCFRADIPATYNLILGYPGEGHRHRIETVRVMTDIAAQYPMTDIAAQYPSVDFSPNRFTPYLGISIWPDLQPLGVVEPTTLAGWARVDLNSNNLPWLRGGALQSLNRAVQYLVSVNRVSAARSPLAPWPLRRTLGFVHRLLSWRLRHGFFDAPMELWLLMARRWLVLRRSLLTGQPLSRELITNDGGLSTCSS